MGLRAIGRVLGVSNVAVLNWIRQAGHWIQAHHKRQARSEREETTMLDKMWHVIEPNQ
jgi:transposase-like protein